MRKDSIKELNESQLEKVSGGSRKDEGFSGSALEEMRKRMAESRNNRHHNDHEDGEQTGEGY